MVNLLIDGKKVCVEEGTTVMEAARSIGIDIPRLCYLKGINEISACKVCIVELANNTIITSCNNPVEEGMTVFTNSPKVRSARKTNVELILSQHDCHCATCVRSRNCNLQALSNDLGIFHIPYEEDLAIVPWDESFPLIRDSKKCIKCMRCIQVCDKVQAVNVWDVQNTGARTTVDVTGYTNIRESNCTLCGQCITHCPTGALRERDDIDKVISALSDPEKITIVQIAPAVRTAWAEELHIEKDKATEGRMVAALKQIGIDYVYDTNFAADVTIMEEGHELLQRLANRDQHKWPMFTSCCPAWMNYVIKKYPQLIPNISTAKSPQQMFGALIKTYFAKTHNIDPKDIVLISVMPCVSKKREATLEGMQSTEVGPDVDVVLTTRELARLIRAEHINPTLLEEAEWDTLFGGGSGAGMIFGATGGVMEAALRTACAVVEGKNPEFDRMKTVRGIEGRKEATFQIGNVELKTCIASGLRNADEIVQDILSGRSEFDFVEIMACPGGCVGGGGQPIRDGYNMAEGRGSMLYHLDEKRENRYSHENKEVQRVYEEFLGEPLGHMSHHLLHVEHKPLK